MIKTHRLKFLLLDDNWEQKEHLLVTLCTSGNQFFECNLVDLPQTSYSLSHSETITLTVTDQLKKVLVGHVEFPVTLLKTSSDWIPLLPPNKSPVLHNFSDQINPPRILIEFTKIRPNTESQETNQDFLESFASDLALVSLIDNSSLDSQDLVQGLEICAKYKRQCILTKILVKQLEFFKDKVKENSEKIEYFEGVISKLGEDKKIMRDEAEKIEKGMIDLIQEKEIQLTEVLKQNSFLENKFRVMDNENEHLKITVSRLELEVESNKFLQKELNNAWLTIRKGEEIQDQLNKKLISLSKTIQESSDEFWLQRQINAKDQEISMLKLLTEEVKRSGDMQVLSLKMEIEELNQLLTSYQNQDRLPATQPQNPQSFSEPSLFDSVLNDVLRKKSPSTPFKKLNTFTLQVNDKIFELAYSREGVHVKLGNHLKKFEEFFQDFSKKSPVRELPSEKTPEKEQKCLKKVLSNAFLKETKSSLNKARNTLSRSPLSSESLKKKPFLI